MAVVKNYPVEVQSWPEKWKELWDERAAILEHEAGYTLREAEKLAISIVLKQMKEEAKCM